MLNWFGRRGPRAKSNFRAARDVVSDISERNSLDGLAMVTAALDALTSSPISLQDRFDEIHLLDSAGQPRLVDLIKEYLATPRHKKARESELWGGTHRYLQELYHAYLLCLQRYESDPLGSMRFKLNLPIAVGRALRALRLQLKWALLRYTVPEQHIWVEMAGLYTFALNHGVAENEVPLYPGRPITVREEFVKGLMVAASSNDTLQPPELDLATRLVDHYAKHFIIAEAPFEGCTHWIDMRNPGPPLRTSKAPAEGASVRYIGAGVALTELAAVEAQFAYSGAMPPGLVYYDNQDDQSLLTVIKHLAQDWAGKTQARKDERRKITSRVTVVPGLPEIFRALDFAVNDSLDFTDQPAAESWIVEDASEGGYGAVIPSVAGDWVEVGSVIGIEGASIRDWGIGVIRRVNRMDGNQQRVGVQRLGSGAQLVTLEQKSLRMDAKSTERVAPESAVLITRDPQSRDQVEVVVRSGMFTSLERTEMMLGDQLFRLKPTQIVERSARVERVAFQVLKIN